MTLKALRGLSSVTAAVTGLLLVYGLIYALEGMSTTIPINRLHELGAATLWMVPWTMLFCLGLEDLSAVTGQGWVFWLGVMLALIFLCYFERNTSESVVTKIGMPLAATAAGLLPHVIQRINFVFIVFSLLAGVASFVVLYRAATLYLSGSSFSTEGIGFLVLTFGTSSLLSGVLSVALLMTRRSVQSA